MYTNRGGQGFPKLMYYAIWILQYSFEFSQIKCKFNISLLKADEPKNQ